MTRLKMYAKIIFSVPASYAGIERIFSGAGMLLAKQRKRMLPNIMKNLVYIR
jgi:hAT family C-terminal dimerisation region